MNKPDGYRYVRQYRRQNGSRPWALYEVQGGRARRVGTTDSAMVYLMFLGFEGPELELHLMAQPER